MADVPTNPWRTESDYVVWESRDQNRKIRVRTATMQGIKTEVQQSSTGDPQTFQEVGGLLLGHKGDGELIIDDFEPVPCEHRIDQGYHLSADDKDALRETIQWIEGGSVPGVSVVGFYRSHVRYGFFFSEEDHKLLARYFPSIDHAFLLLKPREDDVLCNFYFWQDGQLLTGSSDLGAAVKPSRIAAETESLTESKVDNIDRPPSRIVAPALTSFDRKPAGKNWILQAIVAAVLILLAAFLYSTFRNRPAPVTRTTPESGRTVQHPARDPVAPPPTDALAQQPNALLKPSPFRDEQPRADESAPELTMRIKVNSEPERLPGEDEAQRQEPLITSEVTSHVTTQVKTLLANWANALKSGDENAFVGFYAPQLSTYFTKHDVSQEVVRKSVQTGFLKYGSFRVCDISNVKVTLLGPDRAVAVFRKKWATSDDNRFAGEELERCQLARYGTEWKITSEQEIKLYWVRK